MQPRGKALGYPQTCGMAGELAEGVLRGFLGEFAGFGPAARGAKNEAEVACDEFGECRAVAAAHESMWQFSIEPVGVIRRLLGRIHSTLKDISHRKPDKKVQLVPAPSAEE